MDSNNLQQHNKDLGGLPSDTDTQNQVNQLLNSIPGPGTAGADLLPGMPAGFDMNLFSGLQGIPGLQSVDSTNLMAGFPNATAGAGTAGGAGNGQQASQFPQNDLNNLLAGLPGAGNLGVLGAGDGLQGLGDLNSLGLGLSGADLMASGVSLGAAGATAGGADGSTGQKANGAHDFNKLHLQNSGTNLADFTGLGNLGLQQNALAGLNGLQANQLLGNNSANNLLGQFGGLGGLTGLNQSNLVGLQFQGLGLPGMGAGALGLGNPHAAMNHGMRAPNYQQREGHIVPGSAAHVAKFHEKGSDDEIKFFVGGLAYQTQESDMIEYFKDLGTVEDAIVMRDKQTLKGRGFGFVKMRFETFNMAQENKFRIIKINSEKGHFINQKRVDVKSADDYVKPQPGQVINAPPNLNKTVPQYQMFQNQQPQYRQNYMQHQFQNQQPTEPDLQTGQSNEQPQSSHMINKPNPYCIVETKEINRDDSDNPENKEGKKEVQVAYKYPKSKIFVGGLDFKVDKQELEQHFKVFGEIESAVILKDIHTGQSRGFGFVTFKSEAVAQDLIKNKRETCIQGRKVDIKSAEPKQGNPNQPANVIPKRPPHMNYEQQNGPSIIPAYGERHEGAGRKTGENEYESSHSSRGNAHHHYDRERRATKRDRDEHRDRRRPRYDEHRGGDRDRDRRRKDDYHRRRDSPDSRDSSSSYHRSRDRRPKKDKDRRGPHHGASSNRSRSRSNR